MQVIYERCAGDVHKKTVVVTVMITAADGQVQKFTRTFSTMTADLLRLDEWLESWQVDHLAMESTGVYWYPIFNLLEEGRDIVLVNPQHMKAVPGRKTDVKDSEWLADLLRHGLLKASFIPRSRCANCASSPAIASRLSRSEPRRSIACRRYWREPISNWPPSSPMCWAQAVGAC